MDGSYSVKLPDIAGRKGTLFLRGTAPSGDSTFWIQQYPPYIGGEGRLVVEFWNKERIQAVVSSSLCRSTVTRPMHQTDDPPPLLFIFPSAASFLPKFKCKQS